MNRCAVLLGLTLCCCTPPWRGRTKCEETREAVRQLERLVSNYEASEGKWPQGLDQLIRDGIVDNALDPWGRAYLFEVRESKPKAWSEGPNVTSSDDDITRDTVCSSSNSGCTFGH
jgi:hypothetical protein